MKPGLLCLLPIRLFPLAEVVVLRFDHDLAALSAERFARDVLQTRYDMRELVAGEDHRFGRDREGDRRSLPALGKRIGFDVAIVPPAARAVLKRFDARSEHYEVREVRAAS